MKYIVTKEIKSETHVGWILYLQDGAFLFVWFMLVLMLKGRIHTALQLPYLIFSAVIGIKLVLRTRGNPKRRYYQAISLYLMRPKHIYRYYAEGAEKAEKEEKKGGKNRDKAYKRRLT